MCSNGVNYFYFDVFFGLPIIWKQCKNACGYSVLPSISAWSPAKLARRSLYSFVCVSCRQDVFSSTALCKLVRSKSNIHGEECCRFSCAVICATMHNAPRVSFVIVSMYCQTKTMRTSQIATSSLLDMIGGLCFMKSGL